MLICIYKTYTNRISFNSLDSQVLHVNLQVVVLASLAQLLVFIELATLALYGLRLKM